MLTKIDHFYLCDVNIKHIFGLKKTMVLEIVTEVFKPVVFFHLHALSVRKNKINFF